MTKPRKPRSEPSPVPETEDQRWLRILPQPPLTMSAHDAVVASWIEDVMRAGGLAAVEWMFDTGNWPLGDVARGRMLYFLTVLRQRDQEDSRRKAEAAARDAAAGHEAARRQARRDAGWA